MHVLLIEEPSGEGAGLGAALERRFHGKVRKEPSLQAAIELLEAHGDPVDWIVCDYRGTSLALLKCLLTVRPELPCVLVIEPGWTLPDEFYLLTRDGLLETVERADPETTERRLEALLTKLEGEGFFAHTPTPDTAFVRVRTDGVDLKQPLNADIFVRLGKNRYCRRFRKEDGFDLNDLNVSLRSKAISAFYLRKEDAELLLAAQSARVDHVLENPSAEPAESREAAEASLLVVQDVVGRMGFTPEAQRLTRKAAELALKAVGSSPQLSNVLDRLKRHEGRYITSHSLMLAEVACAIAYRVGMASPQNFLKLAMAAFLHDLTMEDDALAKVRSLREIESGGKARFDTSAARIYRLHPVKAAEFASQFNEIPSDVDTILLQHHELPDGSGFPRGLFHHQINPLASLFILAHELLNFFLDQVPSNNRASMIPAFVTQRKPAFVTTEESAFRKILMSLESGEPVEQT